MLWLRFCPWIPSVSFIFPLLCFYLFILCSCDTRVGQDGRERTVRLIIDDDMRIDSLEVIASLPKYQAVITGVVPLFGGKCIDITLRDHEVAARLAASGFDYGDIRKNPYASLAKKLYKFRVLYPWNSQTTLCWNF